MSLAVVLIYGTMSTMKRKHQKTLEAIFARPTSANIQWRDIEALFVELGAEVSEREGSRVAVVLFGRFEYFIVLIQVRILTKELLPAFANG
jgi:hypothetical protein